MRLQRNSDRVNAEVRVTSLSARQLVSGIITGVTQADARQFVAFMLEQAAVAVRQMDDPFVLSPDAQAITVSVQVYRYRVV